MDKMHKYPRTPHIEGSRKQAGDEDMDSVPFAMIAGKRLVVEEKVDGSQAGISFGDEGLRLQSRGHFLAGGPREAQFSLFKSWAKSMEMRLRGILGCRYVMYGEWLWVKHTVFYNDLPHYFMEFDIYDSETSTWLSTARRHTMLDGSGIVSVKVLVDGCFEKRDKLSELIAASNFIDQCSRAADLTTACETAGYDKGIEQTDQTGLMEGLYIKEENDDCVLGRYKFVRKSFLDVVAESGGHWFDRTFVYNKLAAGKTLF